MDLNDLDLLSLKSKAASAQPSKFKPRSKPRPVQKPSKVLSAPTPALVDSSLPSGTKSKSSGQLDGQTSTLRASETAAETTQRPAAAVTATAAAAPPAAHEDARTAAGAAGAAGASRAAADDPSPASAAHLPAQNAPQHKALTQSPAASPVGTVLKAASRSAADAGRAVSRAKTIAAPSAQKAELAQKAAPRKRVAKEQHAKASGKADDAAGATQPAERLPRKGRTPAATKGKTRKTAAAKAAPSEEFSDSQPSDSGLTLAKAPPKAARARKSGTKATSAQKKAATLRAQRAEKRAASAGKVSINAEGVEDAASPTEDAASPTEDSPSPFKGKGRKRKVPAGEEPIDVDKMSLKEVIKWSNDRERLTINAEKAEKKCRAAALAKEREEQGVGGEAEAIPAPLPALPAPRTPADTPSGIAPQVHIIDGQIVINKDTLTVQAQEAGAPRTIVSGLSQTLNNNSYATNRTSSERWLPEETENFYNALATFGSDFQTIAMLFPGKNRRVIKNKFSRESKHSPRRIDEALKGRSCNVSAYKNVLSRMLNGPEEEAMLEITEG